MMHSHLDSVLFLNKQQYVGYKKFTVPILSDAVTTGGTLINFDKLGVRIPRAEIDCANNNCLNTTDNDGGSVANIKVGNNNNRNSSTKIKTNTTSINIANETISRSKVKNKKQRNVSFSNEKLWEINRVNRILHNKISNGVKSNYSNDNHSQFIVRATSTINREKKNRDIIRENEILVKKLKNVKSTIFK